MDKLKLHSPDLTQANIDKLAALFPNCVTESKDDTGAVRRAVDFDQLRQELSTSIVEGPQERYQLNWPGKREALLTANAPIAKTLRPCREESVDFDTTRNLFIEGDNLDALKLLQETYLNKIKLIYIDPPYNTGKDFIYDDDFAENSLTYFHRSAQVDERGQQLVANTETNGRFHSDWLSMMYARIKLGRRLLREDGVMLISIDDVEHASVKRMCDEIFGEENFSCCFNWNTTKGAQGMQRRNMVVPNHEYILAYAKSADSFTFLGQARSEEDFSNPDADARGPWKRQYLQRLGQKLPVRDLRDPTTGKVYSFETPYTQQNIDQWIADGRIIFPRDGTGYPARKEFLYEYKNLKQLVTSLGLFATKSSTEALYALFDRQKIFTNPKPDDLLRFLFSVTLGKDDCAMDFFAGSGTTAHAIMSVNSADGGHRRYILVQFPEHCNDQSEAALAGFSRITEIGKERIRRAGTEIKAASTITAPDLDVGFRVLKIDSSNMNEVYYTPDLVSQDLLSAQVDNIREDRTAEDLLFQVLIDWGIDLTLPIAQEKIAGKTVFFVDGNALAACFETDINEAFVKLLAKRQPLRAVFRDTGFVSDSVKINVEQIFKLMSPATEVKTI